MGSSGTMAPGAAWARRDRRFDSGGIVRGHGINRIQWLSWIKWFERFWWIDRFRLF